MTLAYFSPRAERSVVRIDAWWRKQREASPDLFSRELSSAVSSFPST